MTPSLLLPIAAFVLASASIGGVSVRPVPAALRRRLAARSPRRGRSRGRAFPDSARKAEWPAEKARKRSVASTPREDDERQKRATSAGSTSRRLPYRLRQASLGWTSRKYYLISAGAGWRALPGMACHRRAGGRGGAGRGWRPAVAASLCRLPPPPPARAFPHPVLDAIDVIVRGIKSGGAAGRLPARSLRARRPEPVKGEFKTLVEDQALGPLLGEAVQRLPE